PLAFTAPTAAEDSLEGSWFVEPPTDAELKEVAEESPPAVALFDAAAKLPLPEPDQAASPEPAAPVAVAAPASKANGKIEFSDSDLDVLEALEHLAAGEAPAVESEKVKPPQMVASLIRLLIRKGVIDELEFLEELGRK
ncbi:MAG TPA: hypothetical protein VH208_11695, partial [Myxococcaceae bacterium]|nr:hypothetical protein [Myxococcaceae bacterium]